MLTLRLGLLAILAAPGLARAEPAAAVTQMLERQAAAWNRGDLEAFCAVYAEDATFVSPSGVTRGRAEILARYQKKYDTAEKRGRLSFEVLETRTRGAAASVALRWRIERKDTEASGHSLIVLFRGESGWRIVQDASM